jgi:hypothetical protein
VALLAYKTAAFDIALPSQTPSRRPELLQVEQQLAALLKNLISCLFQVEIHVKLPATSAGEDMTN